MLSTEARGKLGMGAKLRALYPLNCRGFYGGTLVHFSKDQIAATRFSLPFHLSLTFRFQRRLSANSTTTAAAILVP
jgi:hypothetical protein